MGTGLFDRAVGAFSMAGFSGGGGYEGCVLRRSIPPSMVMISRILGEVDVRYTSCVNELKSDNGEVVSDAKSNLCEQSRRYRWSSIDEDRKSCGTRTYAACVLPGTPGKSPDPLVVLQCLGHGGG